MSLPALVESGPPLRRDQVERYSRHLLLDALGEVGQRRLLAARVLVVGAGGLGSPALLYLAAAGVGRLGIVDDDDVDASNLQRQVIHGAADVGRAKVDSAADRLAALNPDVEVVRHRVRLAAGNAAAIVAGYDLVLDGTDNFATRYLVDDTCAALGVPLVWGSILRFDAQVSVFWSRPSGGAAPVTLRDLFPAPPPPGTTPSCAQAGVLGALCGQVGALMATEAVKLLTGTGEPLLGRVAVLDALAARWSEVPLRPGGRRRERTDEAPAEPAAVPTLSATALAARLAARERGADAVVLLDVREAAERTIAVIPGAVHVPLAAVLADPAGVARELDAAPDNGTAADVVVHCRSGERSTLAARALAAAGVPALSLSGGILAWARDVDLSLPIY
ncbi:molybdopterin-synthase adenylyltransferase MoeB [Georgenia faecalis]|uniref:Molybdopterin-synthase adenylyltransferase MoeB n=1 Tax=Georgenia faecalis TaxID=2483799 RepID=A0ABV9D768_9MICO|nr:molybdopterin-synthase adenylyltransferase MoeB [Georgenia faecalis]